MISMICKFVFIFQRFYFDMHNRNGTGRDYEMHIMCKFWVDTLKTQLNKCSQIIEWKKLFNSFNDITINNHYEIFVKNWNFNLNVNLVSYLNYYKHITMHSIG